MVAAWLDFRLVVSGARHLLSLFSKVAFLCLLALLDPALFAWLALWDADLIDADSLEWELAGAVTFRNIGVVFSKVTFLHSFSFLLDLVLCL